MNFCVEGKMWGESSQNCENNCQCSGLITDSFRINSGNSATKRKQAEAASANYKSRMHPHSLDFKTPLSPLLSPRATPSKRRVLGELQNSQNLEYSISTTSHSPFKNQNSNKIESPSNKSWQLKSPQSSFFKKLHDPENSPQRNSQDSGNSPFKYPQSPYRSPRSTILGEIKNSPRVLGERSIQSSYFYKSSSSSSTFTSHSTREVSSGVSLSSLLRPRVSPAPEQAKSQDLSPVSSRRQVRRSSVKISRIFEERSRFKMSSSNKENISTETFMKLDFEEASLEQESSLDFDKTLEFPENSWKFPDVPESSEFPEPSVDFPEPNLNFPESSLDFPKPSLDVPESSIDFPEPSLNVPEQSLDFEGGSTELGFKESRLESEQMTFEDHRELEEFNRVPENANLSLEEETRPFGFQTESNWSATKLDFTHALHLKSSCQPEGSKLDSTSARDFCVPDKGDDLEDTDFETLHDLEEEFDNDNFDLCTKYEIISTDSPDIISRGRTDSSRKISSKSFVFGAPIGAEEPSTSFNVKVKSSKANVSATRMLNFEDECFEFTSPASKRSSVAVKKSLKFTESPLQCTGETPRPSDQQGATKLADTPTKTKETPTKIFERCLKYTGTPTKLRLTTEPLRATLTPTTRPLHPLRHERSDSSIGSMLSSPTSSQSHFRLFTSESTTSMESGFVSELEEPLLELEEHSNSPKMANFNDLLSGPIKVDIFSQTKSFLNRPTLQRSLSFNPEGKARQSLFDKQPTIDTEKKSQKRQEPLLLEVASKKRKPDEEVKRPILQRAYSENHASIMSALTRSCTEPDLIADFSLPYALPLTAGRHDDLKAISCDTLAALIRGDYRGTIGDYQVIDCRYPYEYEGGHIASARNLYTPAQVRRLLDNAAPSSGGKRSILVFHCEFSLERGPKLYRYLRSTDRSKNAENYPNLHYPEVYLLHEGYRTFYQRFPLLCSPAGYTPMLHPGHVHQLRLHRSGEARRQL